MKWIDRNDEEMPENEVILATDGKSMATIMVVPEEKSYSSRTGDTTISKRFITPMGGYGYEWDLDFDIDDISHWMRLELPK